MVVDHIGDMLIRIQNAGMAGHDVAKFPYSKMKETISEILTKEGYLKFSESKGKGTKKTIEVGILYNEDGKPKISGVKRVSKQSRRVYQGYKGLKPVKFGYGLLVLSTPKGILTQKDALTEKVGGEALFEIW